MKTVILLRHAKSEDVSLIKPDFKRNLKERGIQDIRRIANKLNETAIFPDVVLCSSANRTKETFNELNQICRFKCPVEFKDELYHATASDIFDQIFDYSSTYNTILVVGHNFGISQLANYLSIDAVDELPTSGLLILEFENEINASSGKTLFYFIPKAI